MDSQPSKVKEIGGRPVERMRLNEVYEMLRDGTDGDGEFVVVIFPKILHCRLDAVGDDMFPAHCTVLEELMEGRWIKQERQEDYPFRMFSEKAIYKFTDR